MPKLWKFKSKAETEAPKVETYQFLAAEDMDFGAEDEIFLPDSVLDEPGESLDNEAGAGPEPVEVDQETDPVNYAQIQSDIILQDARSRAEEILRQAEERAGQECEQVRKQAEEDGYQAGFQRGLQEGTAKAMAEGAQAREEQAKRLEDEVEAFLKKADQAVEQQLNDNIDELRDLALAVAEKVICVSLKSSADVIWRMIQTAIDKRRRREWVHIYIAECDARRRTTLPPALTAALSELSDRVRITPMADDEPGTCIVEFPDEIIDASASTQLQNIRELLGDSSGGNMMTNLNFKEK